jgi:hypothetical protein
MNLKIRIVLLFVVLATLALPGVALAKGLRDDRVVAGGSFTLESGETQDGNLVVLGGLVALEDGSQVNGDVVLLGGTLDIDGTVTGNVVGVGGIVTLEPNAVVEGDVTTAAASLVREEGSQVEGQVITGLTGGPFMRGPGSIEVPQVPQVDVRFPPVWGGLWFLFRTFLWAALAVLIVMFLPTQVERTAETIVRQPALSGAVGLLTAVVAPLLLVAIALTILLIPVSLIGVLVLAVAWFVGRIALGFEIGRRIAVMMNQDWPLAVAAGIGTFILTLVVDGIGQIIPCVGWLVPALVGVVGLGAIFLTRFGTQSYPPDGAARPVYPTPPPPDAPVLTESSVEPPQEAGAVIYDSPVPPPAEWSPEPPTEAGNEEKPGE